MKYLSILLVFIVTFTFIFGALFAYNYALEKQAEYAKAHNCVYDYNGLCYTESERPWLFK